MTNNSLCRVWADEELNELHNELYAFLSFMNVEFFEILGKRDPLAVAHVRALKRSIEMRINDHGGREYKPKQQEGDSVV